MRRTKSKMAFIFFLFVGIGSIHAQQDCIQSAWDAINADKDQEAIEYCDQCIDRLTENADKRMEELKAQGMKASDFPTGVVNESQEKGITENWAINDISTAYFIKGRAAESLFDASNSKDKAYKKMATESYKKACEYGYGRCWDPKGWFWSPCDASKDRLPIK